MNIDIIYREAERLFLIKKFKESLDNYLLILKTQPDTYLKINIFSGISSCYAWLGDSKKAEEYSKKCFLENDNELESIYHEALNYYHNGRYEESIKLLDKLLRKNKENFKKGNLETWYSKSLSSIGNFELAEKYFEIAYSLVDKIESPFLYASLLYEYGNVLYELDKLEQAISIFSECEKYVFYLTPSNTITFHSMYSRLLLITKNFNNALNIANKLVYLIKDNISYSDIDKVDYYLLVSRIFVKNNEYQKALSLLENIKEDFEEDWDLFEYLEIKSICYYELNDLIKAKHYLCQIVQHPITKGINENREYSFRKMLGITLYKLENYIEAKEVFRKLVQFSNKYDIESNEIQEYLNKLKNK